MISRRLSAYLIIFISLLSSCDREKTSLQVLNDFAWIHGSADCTKNTDPAIQVFKYDESTYILRQNKCVHYEAPFMYLFLGDNKALLIDTGATSEERSFPLYKTVSAIIEEWKSKQGRAIDLIVAHTHNHSDHRAADVQFQNKEAITVVGLQPRDVADFFQIADWPNSEGMLDLGNRKLTIIPIPGHEPSSIAVYDPSTKFLLTGDSMYPGRLYVRDWQAFKASARRLVEFSANHEVVAVMGNHIEMSRTAGVDYPVETIYQPEEHRLPLQVQHLQELLALLEKAGDEQTKVTTSDFIIYPVE